MPEGSRWGSQRSPSNTAAKRPSSVSSLSGIVGRMMSSGDRGASSSSCTSVNTVCSDGERLTSLSSSASSVSLQDASHSSSSSSSSLPYGVVPTYNSSSSFSSSSIPKRNGSDISLDLTPLVTPHGGGGTVAGGGGGICVARATGGHPTDSHVATVMAPTTLARPRQLSRVERVVMEIVETEQAYVRDLKSIVEDYLGCIIDCGDLPLKPEEVSTLFCNIEDIYEFNSDLLEDLERSPHAAAIAECFVERSEAFDIYTLYCMNYPNSVAVLRECMKNQSLVHFFQERQMTLNHSLPLETYLLKPVQRILKYHLLLQELSKHFDKSAPGYEIVEDAIITMTAVAWYINDMKRKQEHAVRLQEIESLLVNWSGPDLSGFGELVLEGSFKVHRVKKERAFFLFDKMLLIAKKRLEHFVYSTHIFCCNLLLVETLKDSLCFKVSDQTIPKQQHIVQTKNQEEKRLWVHYLKRLIVENHPASLPLKARQVLGDNFCQSPQFDQDNLKKSSASPRLDDIYSYHRGRRQSEPPELLMYTPEKSRKSLPLLLEGNLPYRRTRRQSAPAKDIEAAFNPNALMQAGSEGELCQADSLGSAGSSSTLASSVIEVEAERDEQGLTLQPRASHEEEEEEGLAPFSPPPTLSITEEILEFINQSRAREGLTSINTNAVVRKHLFLMEKGDQSKESEPPTNWTNFTCPLAPIASSSSSDQRPASSKEQDKVKMEDDSSLPQKSKGQSSCGKGNETDRIQEIPNETSQMEKRGKANDETQGQGVDRENEENKAKEEGNGQIILCAVTSALHPSISVKEEIGNNSSCHLHKEEANTEATTSTLNPDLLHHPIQKCQPPTRGSHLTKHDMKIIEKIRSYYEAAAEAEKDDAEVEHEQGEGEVAASRRRNSFSQIPSGLVKESVSRFDVGGQTDIKGGQAETEIGQNKYETTEASDRKTSAEAEPSCQTGPISSTTPLLTDAENDSQQDKPIPTCLNFDAGGLPPSTEMHEKESSFQLGLNLQLNQDRPTGEENEIQDTNINLCIGPLEERQDRKTNVLAFGEHGENSLQGERPSIPKYYGQETKTCARNKGGVKKNEPHRGAPVDKKGNYKEHFTPLIPTGQNQKTETRNQSILAVTKHKDLEKTSIENLPSHIKVGRWSDHSRIVSANRALFEAMGSDVAGIGLFESSPAVDPVLIENSERILSKVQTLARMYSAKASTMKVPLHQKRASGVRNQSWSSGSQTQSQNTSREAIQSQTEKFAKHWQQTQYKSGINQSDNHLETETGAQTYLETKIQSQPTTQTRKHSQVQTKSQLLSQTHYPSQNQIRAPGELQVSCKDQRIQEETLTTDFQRTAMPPCEPLLFGHMIVKEQLISACQHQTNEFNLSRPRDFISALTKERNSIEAFRSADKSDTSCHTTGKYPSNSNKEKLSSQAEANTYNLGCASIDCSLTSTIAKDSLSRSVEYLSPSLCYSATKRPMAPTMTLDCGVTDFKDKCTTSSVGKGGDTGDTEKREGSEHSPGHLVSLVREDSTSADIITQSAHKYKQDISKRHIPECMDNKDTLSKVVQSSHTAPEYMDGDPSPGELELTVTTMQWQSPPEYQSSVVHPGQQSQLEKDELQTEQIKGNKTKFDLNYSFQSRMTVQGSAVIFSEGISDCRSSREQVISPELNESLPPTFEAFQVSSCSKAENPDRKEGAASSSGPSPSPSQPRPPSAQTGDCQLPFISQRPTDVPTTIGNSNSYENREPDQQDSGFANNLPIFRNLSESSSPSRHYMETARLAGQTNPATDLHSQDTENNHQPSAFRPGNKLPCPSLVRPHSVSTPPSPSHCSARAPTCSSPFSVVPVSSLTAGSTEDFISPSTVSMTLSCSSPTPSTGMISSIRAPPASSPTLFTASGKSSSVKASVHSPPTPSSSLNSSTIISSSAFTRSLAASYISQSISQSMAKKNTVQQQAPPSNSVNSIPSSMPAFSSSHLQQPSPKLPPSQQSSSTPANAQRGNTKAENQHPRCPLSSPLSSCPSPSALRSPPHSFLHHSLLAPLSPAQNQPVQSVPQRSLTSPRPSYLHSKSDPLQNANNNNSNFSCAGLTAATTSISNTSSCNTYGALSNGVWPGSPQKLSLANGNTNVMVMQQTNDPLWLGTHNRVARPFSASEPNSRVQSPAPSPTHASFAYLCSPPPQHKYTSPMANKPPHPQSPRAGGVNSHNPVGLSLELLRVSSVNSAFGQSSSCVNPRILSPPPIGVSVNVWGNNVATPQPRHPRFISSLPSCPFSSNLDLPAFPSSSPSSVPLHSSIASSPSAPCPATQMTSQTLHRSLSTSLADRPPSPAGSNSIKLRHSRAESNRRPLGFSGRGQGSFDQQVSCPTSPKCEWSSFKSSPPCISPPADLQSPLSPTRLTTGKNTVGGQYFTNVPWTDVQELSDKYNGTDVLDTGGTSNINSPIPLSSLSHSFLSCQAQTDSHTEWGESEAEEGNCRSQLICAYVAHPFHEQNLPSPCLPLSCSGTSSTPTSYQSQVKPQPQVQSATRTPPTLSVHPALPSTSSPLPFVHSTPTKPGYQKTSYATTVNLQIAGSGRITSFSTAQVSLTQTLQGGAVGPEQGQMVRRVSINGLSHLSSPLPQNCDRL
ncbi:uncharacterized protein plekhg2 isoform X2 [Echeneis naucrates]|uniref:uncharacterized protein plekhg2 isoform X2 n=1 Tax=Echeneis naucrates TaxID=173247 RepID=UPI001113BC26|nr:pleckstrin homology domain-containing family G member 2 isoform X2 [Echeneis naucrates]